MEFGIVVGLISLAVGLIGIVLTIVLSQPVLAWIRCLRSRRRKPQATGVLLVPSSSIRHSYPERWHTAYGESVGQRWRR
jgi:hypothetical protein